MYTELNLCMIYTISHKALCRTIFDLGNHRLAYLETTLVTILIVDFFESLSLLRNYASVPVNTAIMFIRNVSSV